MENVDGEILKNEENLVDMCKLELSDIQQFQQMVNKNTYFY